MTSEDSIQHFQFIVSQNNYQSEARKDKTTRVRQYIYIYLLFINLINATTAVKFVIYRLSLIHI